MIERIEQANQRLELLLNGIIALIKRNQHDGVIIYVSFRDSSKVLKLFRILRSYLQTFSDNTIIIVNRANIFKRLYYFIRYHKPLIITLKANDIKSDNKENILYISPSDAEEIYYCLYEAGRDTD